MRDNLNTSSPKKSTSHIRTSSRRNGVRLTKEEVVQAKEKFLASFAKNGNVRAACMVAGIDRTTIHNWSEHDEQFSMQYNLAKADVDDGIRGEIFRRAMLGDDETTTEQVTVLGVDGKPIEIRHKTSTSKRKSDTLLIFHAKARMPEYRDKQQVEISGSLSIKTEWGTGVNEESEVQHDRIS